MPKDPNERPVTLRHTAKELKAAEARQVSARADLAKGRASVARGRVAIARGRATLIRRAMAGEPDLGLAPIRANFDAAEADLNAATQKLNAAAARIEAAERRLDEARGQARAGVAGAPIGRPNDVRRPRAVRKHRRGLAHQP